MHSHISVIQNGKQEYIREISAETYKKLYEMGTIFLNGNALITDVKPNTTT
jgi:SepF-like predicted cell division protein (DUF552 family)